MDTIETFRTLVAVVEHGSFSAAARKMRVNRSVISRNIAYLERNIGSRLLNRTTRSISLTDSGKAYIKGISKILSDIDILNDSIMETNTKLRGNIRISAPIHFGEQKMISIINDFLIKHEEINIVLDLSNTHVDVIEKGFDLVIRTAPLIEDSSMVARRISVNHFTPCASPSYCEIHGRPDTPDDLRHHSCIATLQHAGAKNWVFLSPDGTLVSAPINPRLTVNAGSPQIRAAVAGLGIALIPEYIVEAAEEAGELIRLLPHYTHESYPIFAIYPHRELMPHRTRVFLDDLIEALRACPA